MDIKKDFQFHFETGSQDFYMMEYLLPPIILFLGIILFYVFIKKRILRDEKEDLESLKLLQELLDAGTITENEFKKKKNRITSKWWWKSQSILLIIERFTPDHPLWVTPTDSSQSDTLKVKFPFIENYYSKQKSLDI